MLLVFGAPCQLLSLAGQEHGRTIPLADIDVLKARGPLVLSGCGRPHPKHRQLLLHASKLRCSRLDRKTRQFVANARRLVDVLADKNLVGVGKILHARGDVHCLPEIIEPLVQRDRDRRALVDADLQDQRLVGLPLVESGDLAAHVERRLHRVGGIEERRHDRIADRLDDRAVVADRHVLQPVEMLLHEREGVQVADPVVERGRALQVGEEKRDVLDAEPLVAADHLGAEEVAETSASSGAACRRGTARNGAAAAGRRPAEAA